MKLNQRRSHPSPTPQAEHCSATWLLNVLSYLR